MFIMLKKIQKLMRVRKRLVRKGKDDKPFYKYEINLPPDAVKALNWDHGTELSYELKNKEMRLKKEKK